MQMVSTVSFLKTVESGTSISYGRRYVASRKTVIATIPVGYADGFFRALTGNGEVLIRGKRYPVVGTICMDAIMADLGPASEVALGDQVTVFGHDGAESITAWDIAATIGTIPYEVTCLVSPRVPRVFVK